MSINTDPQLYAATLTASIAEATDGQAGTVVMVLLCEALDHYDVGEQDRGLALTHAAATIASDWRANLIAAQEQQRNDGAPDASTTEE